MNEDLIERLLKAPFGSIELDMEIARRMGQKVRADGWVEVANPMEPARPALAPVPNFTSFIDVAKELVAPGWYWSVDSRGVACADLSSDQTDERCQIEASAATPALALCVVGIRSWEYM